MRKILSLVLMLGLLSICLASLLAHDPNILYINQKSVSAKLGDVEVKLDYYSPPATEAHLQEVEVGAFQRWFGKLTLSGELKAGHAALEAGEYVVGAIKNSGKDWTMALYPGEIKRGEEPDLSKLIKLDSAFSKSSAVSPNVSFDISVGAGKLAKRYVLVWRFGTYSLSGALS